MRPLELTIEGLRSFREPVTLDLRGRDQIAIVGDTGAGKSSIIEAITYALYGQPTFSAPNRELMNDSATVLRVGLRFQVAGEEWEVVRTLRRRSSGTVTSPSAQLRRFDESGELLEMVEQARPVSERIESMIGLDCDAFLRTTVLPQGRFAQLLVTDKPADRSNILRQVWRTEELEQAGELTAAARHEIAALRGRIEQAASRYPEDPIAHLASLREHAQQAGRASDKATAAEQESAAALAALQAADAALVLVGAAANRLSAFDATAMAAELEPIAVVAHEIGSQEAILRKRHNAVTKNLSAIPADDDGPSVAQVATALTTLDGIPQRTEEAVAAATDLKEQTAAVEDGRTAAERSAAEARRAADALADHDELRPPLEQALQAAERRRDQISESHAAALKAVRAVETGRDELAGHERNRHEVADALRAAAAEAARRAAEVARAEEHLAVTRRSDSAAVIAGALHPGDECPICRSTLAKDWEAPSGIDLSAAEQEAQAADDAADAAREAEIALATRRDAAVDAVGAAEERLRAVEAAAAEARRTLAEAVMEPDGDSLPALDAAASLPEADLLLAPLRREVAAAEGVLAENAQRREELASGAADQKTAARVAAEAAASAERLHDAANQSAADALSRLRDAVASVPGPYRPPVVLPPSPQELREPELESVQDLIAVARERERVLAERAESRKRLTDLLGEIASKQTKLERRRSAEVDGLLEGIVRHLSEHRDLLAQSATQLGLEPDLPDVLNAAGHEVVAAMVDRLFAATVDLMQVAADRKERATAARDGAWAKLRKIGEPLPGSGDDDPEAIVARVRVTAESARYAARTAQDRAEEFAAVVDPVSELRKLLADVLQRERALADLGAALKEGGFPKWLTLRRSRSLIVHASRTLEQISAGRYAFVEPADEFDRWQVLDRDSGQPRSPSSLSGGEQFIASLALALGMVEMMARSGGSLESLFLDEGFGSLDRSNLDAAIEALGSVAAGGRMVVLISHVQAVAEQVAYVATVIRTPAGSKVEWLSDAQRRQFVDSDLGAAALSGLLE